MDTVEIVGNLLFKIPTIKTAFFSLGIISQERQIQAVEMPEFHNILLQFNSPIIISVVGITQLTLVIEPIFTDRKIPVIVINGKDCQIVQMSMTLLQKTLYGQLIIKDFLPSPFVKKIIYISEYGLRTTLSNEVSIKSLIDHKKEFLSGVVFSEYIKGFWTFDDPMSLPAKNIQEVNPNVILSEILEDLKTRCLSNLSNKI